MQRRFFFPTALCIALVAGTPAMNASAADPTPTPEARQHFKRGLELLKSQQNDEALRELRAAYAITPKWTALVSIGIASERLERDGDAIDAYQGYLDQGGTAMDGRERGRVLRTIERLRANIATVKIEAPGAFWLTDRRVAPEGPIVNEYGPFDGKAELRVRAGQHEFKLDRTSITAPVWSAPLLAGDVATHVFETEPRPALVETFDANPAPVPSEPGTDVPRPSHVASYVLLGTGGLGLVAAPTFWLKANSVQRESDDDFTRRCPSGATGVDGCDGTTAGSIRAARWRTGALLTGIGALGALATGTVLFVLDSPEPHASDRAAEARVRPWVSPTSVGISGTF